MNFQHLEAKISDDERESLERFTELTPQQLKTVAEFVVQAGGIENPRAASEAVWISAILLSVLF